MTHFPALRCLLFLFLLIKKTVCSSIELKRLNTSMTRLILKQESTQLDVAQLQDEFEQLRNEVHQARQQMDVLSNIINGLKVNGSGENNCSCEANVNVTKELHDIQHHRLNDSERILKLELFVKTWTDDVSEKAKIISTAKEIAIGFRQEKQRRKFFEMKTDASLFAINDTIFSTNQTCQSSYMRKENDESIEKMNSTLQRLIVDMEGIQSSVRGQSSIPETTTTSFRTMASTKSMTSHLCTRTVTDETTILNSIKLGSRVVRGKDWAWGNQDGLPPTAGTVEKVDSLPGWIWVRWDSGMYVNYRLGESNKFDLFICE